MATDTTAAPATSARANIKRVGADFTEEEYAKIRESRFVKRLDKDSDVIKLAVSEFFEKHGIKL